MKHLLLTTIAAVVLVGCATTESPEPQTAKAPDISLFEAADRGNIEAVKQHIAAGTDVNAKDVRGWTPLLYAAQEGHNQVVELLIENGADMNQWEKGGETPLDLTNLHPETETADLLRKHGGKTGKELKAEGK